MSDKNVNSNLSDTLKSIYNSLTDEQKKKAKQCKSIEELAAFAGEEGLELPDEVLDAVAGGRRGGTISEDCPWLDRSCDDGC